MSKRKIKIETGRIVRWFCIDYPKTRIANWLKTRIGETDRHDAIMDKLLDVTNAKEANSGHTGFNVALEDDTRPDAEIMEEIKTKLAEVW